MSGMDVQPYFSLISPCIREFEILGICIFHLSQQNSQMDFSDNVMAIIVSF